MGMGEHKDLENDMSVFVKGKRKHKALISNMKASVQKDMSSLRIKRKLRNFSSLFFT